MMHRLFDRESLRLIPSLEFDAPIPKLEEIIRHGGEAAVGLQWVNADGRTWRQSHQTERGRGVYYNILHPSVQKAVHEAFREVVGRYGAHPSFAGIALKLSRESYIRLPSAEWGMDDVTIGRFERETGLQVSSSGPDRFAARAAFLTKEQNRKAWLQWRARQMRSFYLRLRDEVVKTNPKATFYLTDVNGNTEDSSSPTSVSRQRPTPESLLETGVDPALYAKERQIELVFSHVAKPSLSPNDLIAVGDRTALSRVPSRSVLFEHQPAKRALPSFDAKSPWPSYTSLVSQPTPSGSQNRRRFVSSLAARDAANVFDGGWLLPMGQEEVVRELASVYVALPNIPFQEIPAEKDAGAVDMITVRRAVCDGKTYFYAVNDTGLRVKGRLRVDAPAKAQIAELTGRRVIEPIRGEGDSRYWSFELAPYDVIAAKIASPDVRLAMTQTTLGEEVWSELRRRVRELGIRASTLQQPPPIEMVNADFETPGNPFPGWEPATGIALAEGEGINGSTGLKLSGKGEPIHLSSVPFRIRPTGKLRVTVALRVADEKKQPILRLSVAGMGPDGDFYRYAYLGTTSDGRPAGTRLRDRWQRIALDVNDIPLEGLETLTVGFDLLSEGEVFIDGIEVHDLLFKQNEQIEIAKLISLAGIYLEKGRLRDCLEILDSYWFRFLEENVPVRPEIVARHAARRTPKRTKQAPAKKESKGFLDHVKGLWPSRARF